MRTSHLFGGLFLFLSTLSSCSGEEHDFEKSDGKVKLNAVLADDGRTKIGTSWAGDEHVGVFMTESAAFTAVGGVVNKEYTVSAGAGNSLTAVDGDALYPIDGRDVRFTAYYPYDAEVRNNTYKINLSDATRTDHDLLYCQTEGVFNQTQEGAIPLTFRHQLSKLVLHIKLQQTGLDGEVVTETISDWTARIVRSTMADFDLATGTLKNISGSKVLTIPRDDVHSELIILPGSEGNVIITYQGEDYHWNIKNLEFSNGVQYTYTVTLKMPDPDIPDPDPISVKLESTITDWDNVDGDVEIDDNTGESGNQMIYTSNIDLAAFTSTTSFYQTAVVIDETEYPALKFGSTNSAGSGKSPAIGGGRTKLTLYAVSWSTKSTELKITVSNGGTINGRSNATITPAINAGASGSVSAYKLAVGESDYYEFTLADTTAETILTFETTDKSTEKRAVVFAVNVK